MKAVKRCFIENDNVIDEHDKELLLERYGIDFNEHFCIVILGAYELKQQVWYAINHCSEIWISTSFVGDSGRLFTDMLGAAIKKGLKNKTIVNLREFSDVTWHLADEHRKMMKLLASNNIKFIFKDDKEFDTVCPRKRQ